MKNIYLGLLKNYVEIWGPTNTVIGGISQPTPKMTQLVDDIRRIDSIVDIRKKRLGWMNVLLQYL